MSGNTECTAEMSSVSSEVFHSGEFHSDGVEALVWFPKEPSSEQFLKEPFFLNAKNIWIIYRTFVHYKEACVEWKDSLDFLSSSWNHN